MKQEYDFSNANHGQFFHNNAKLNLPVYLDDEVQSYLQERAKSKGVNVAQLVLMMGSSGVGANFSSIGVTSRGYKKSLIIIDEILKNFNGMYTTRLSR